MSRRVGGGTSVRAGRRATVTSGGVDAADSRVRMAGVRSPAERADNQGS